MTSKNPKKAVLSFIIFLLIAFATRALFIAADTSRPGDRLFGLDQILEKMEVASAQNQAAKARLEIAQTDERFREAEQLILGVKSISGGERSFVNTAHAQDVSGRSVNSHDVREALSLFQVYLIDSEARVLQLKGTSEYEDLLAIMAEMLFFHQETWESLRDLIPVDLLDTVRQASNFMNKSLARIIKALPIEKRLALAEKLKSKIPEIESKINSAASAKEVIPSGSSQQTTPSPTQEKTPNANIKTGSGGTSVGVDIGDAGIEIPAGVDTGLKKCIGLQVFGICVGQGN